LHLLAAAHLDDLLGGDHHLVDLVLEALLGGLGADLLGDLFSKFERTDTEYQRFAIRCVPSRGDAPPGS
jgi:hypothetical protein